MTATRITRMIPAPPVRVFEAFLDARLVQQWMVPPGMTGHVHEFEGREGGRFRVSLTYDEPFGQGKSSAHTDTYRGRFIRLVPNREIVEELEFETSDAALTGLMTLTVRLTDKDGATEITAEHAGLPPGLSPEDNELGWRLSLDKLAALLEPGRSSSP